LACNQELSQQVACVLGEAINSARHLSSIHPDDPQTVPLWLRREFTYTISNLLLFNPHQLTKLLNVLAQLTMPIAGETPPDHPHPGDGMLSYCLIFIACPFVDRPDRPSPLPRQPGLINPRRHSAKCLPFRSFWHPPPLSPRFFLTWAVLPFAKTLPFGLPCHIASRVAFRPPPPRFR
jgi:hypothetical protein